jgi:p-cumate 2,3-dioxygenase alpha subunit
MTSVDGLSFNAASDMVLDDLARGVFRVHRDSMTCPEIFRLERERIFEKTWLYLGHESEVAQPGDYLQRTLLGRPLIFLRDRKGTVRVFYNSCPHRGALICREPAGNTRQFQCFYHAWSFDTEGRLVSLPDKDGYGPGFDRRERALLSPARLEAYRGFWFVSYDRDVIPLVDHLAGATEYFDLIVDQAEEGMRIIPGSNKYTIKANWKLLVENSVDGYHGLPLHQSYFAYVKALGGGIQTSNLVGRGPQQLGRGHVVLEGEAPYGRPIARWDHLFGEAAKADIDQIRLGLVERNGPERAATMADTFRNMLVFPNLMVLDITALTLRYIEPVAPDTMEVTAWALAPREERGERLRRRIDSYLTFIGPGGFATPDDVEALESCQLGFATEPGKGWSDMSRGMTREPTVLDELQMRVFWRTWAALLDGRPAPEPVALPETRVETDAKAGREHGRAVAG